MFLPMTANISVFVKCLYRDNLTGFLLNFRVLMVCARLTKMFITVKGNTVIGTSEVITTNMRLKGMSRMQVPLLGV